MQLECPILRDLRVALPAWRPPSGNRVPTRNPANPPGPGFGPGRPIYGGLSVAWKSQLSSYALPTAEPISTRSSPIDAQRKSTPSQGRPQPKEVIKRSQRVARFSSAAPLGSNPRETGLGRLASRTNATINLAKMRASQTQKGNGSEGGSTTDHLIRIAPYRKRISTRLQPGRGTTGPHRLCRPCR